MTARAFDTIAVDYDARFTHKTLGRLVRSAVWAHLEMAFSPGDHILELGCGTGEDAVWLAQQGLRVLATDASPAMLEVARRKAEPLALSDHLRFARLDLHTFLADASSVFPPTPFDGVFSNFGALNCVEDHERLAAQLAPYIRPGGKAMFVVMGPCCPWEWGWYLSRGRVGTAFRRFRKGHEARVGDDQRLRVWYPSPRQMRRAWAPYFRHRQTTGIGVVLPPSYASHVVERWPAPFERLAHLDRVLGSTAPGTWLNDHYLLLLERTELLPPHG